MEKVVSIAEKEVFSNKKPTVQEKRFLVRTVNYAAGKAYANAKFAKRLWYRWGKCY